MEAQVGWMHLPQYEVGYKGGCRVRGVRAQWRDDGRRWSVRTTRGCDILAAGEGVTKAEDAYEPHGEPKCYAERLYVLLNRFKFGSVDYQDKQMFCGCQLTQAMDASSVTFDLEKYLHQLKPLSIEKQRKANPAETPLLKLYKFTNLEDFYRVYKPRTNCL